MPSPRPITISLQRAWLGIPRFGDVASNLPFAVIGFWGLAFLAGSRNPTAFTDRHEKILYALVFAGLLLTAFGSSYYHLAPDNARLVWDRLPMTIVFMTLVAAMIAERIDVKTGLYLLAPLVAIGIVSVNNLALATSASTPPSRSTPWSSC